MPEVGLDRLLSRADFAGGRADEDFAEPRQMQVERIEVVSFAAADADVDAKLKEREILFDAADAPLSIVKFQFDLVCRRRRRPFKGRRRIVLGCVRRVRDHRLDRVNFFGSG